MKKVNAFGYLLCVSAVLSLVGLVVYLVSALTGYLAGSAAVNAFAIILPLLVTAGAVYLFWKPTAFSDTITGIITFVLAIAMAVATVIFLVERVDVISDMLNPVNHADTQVTAVIWSIVGIALYLVSFLTAAIATMGNGVAKK